MLRILFISRAYPPIVGGIENQNFALSKELGSHAEVHTLANRFGKKFLPLFLPYALIRTILSLHRYDALLLGDGVLAVIGWTVKLLFPRKAVLSVIHGLDITYQLPLYQRLWVRTFIPELDRLIAVGNETLSTIVQYGIPRDKCSFIPNGINPDEHFHPEYTKKDLEGVIDASLFERKTLLTIGRLARRKGVAWFIRNVLPSLPKETLYIIAGHGPDEDNIRAAIQETKLFTRIKLLGYVTDRTRDILMNTVDIFVQPNIPVPHDMEGFGLTPLEAASCETPVVVSRLEGLQDAFSDGENGLFAEPENAEDWQRKIESLLANESKRKDLGKRARHYSIQRFNWKTISARYTDIIRETVEDVSNRTSKRN